MSDSLRQNSTPAVKGYELPAIIEVRVGTLLNPEVPAGAKALAVLLRVYEKNGMCQVPQKQLARNLNVEKRTVSRWLRILVGCGIISPVSKLHDTGKPITYKFR